MNLHNSELQSARPWQLVALAIVLVIEAATCFLAAGWLLYELFSAKPASLLGAIFILLLVVLAGGWLVYVAISTLKARPWIRGAVVTWQVLQLAVAVGSFQGLFARDDIGWFLLVPVVLSLILLFTKPVLRATTRDSSQN